MTEVIKALSFRQKFAWLTARGFKTVENRPWRTRFRGRFLIHASASTLPLPGWSEGKIKGILTPLEYEEWLGAPIYYGVIIGAGTVVDCVDSAGEINIKYKNICDARWFTGPHALIIVNAVPYDKPIPCRGALGFFVPQLTAEGLALLEEQRRLRG